VSPADFLRRLVEALEGASVPYMVVGSFASVAYGIPRSTQDVDVVIDPDRASLDRFLVAVPDTDYYLDPDVARDALRRRGMFNVIDLATSWKADLIVCKARPFSREELRRRVRGEIAGVPCMIATPEDTILAKLEWARASSSERQLDDVRGIVATSGAALDRAYLDRWAADLGVADLWERLR
jgi:hypothetical protein